MPELFVGPDEERRARDGFALTDRRMKVREIESEVDYCLFCHDRDKDSCSKGLRDNKTGAIKPNPLGVDLNGCPLDEKISEMHLMRQGGDSIAALALDILIGRTGQLSLAHAAFLGIGAFTTVNIGGRGAPWPAPSRPLACS